MNSGKFRRGFTLIELLVVMVIVASLLAIAVPRYLKSLDRSKEVVLMQDLAVMRDAIDQYYEDKGRYPNELQQLATDRYIRKVPADPITNSIETWITVSRVDGEAGEIFDIRSGAEGQTSRGVPYSDL